MHRNCFRAFITVVVLIVAGIVAGTIRTANNFESPHQSEGAKPKNKGSSSPASNISALRNESNLGVLSNVSEFGNKSTVGPFFNISKPDANDAFEPLPDVSNPDSDNSFLNLSIPIEGEANDLTSRFKWGEDKVRGVNLGGWLVLESYITPSYFYQNSEDYDVYDEWTLCQKLGKDSCYKLLKWHWDTFVTISDFWKIKNAGFNAVRIPVGYWSYLDIGGPYTAGAAPYLDRAIEWANETQLKVIIDLHGLPESQNGFDHSGQRRKEPGWGKGDSLGQSHAVLWTLYNKFAITEMRDIVIGIQPVNEPWLDHLDSNMVKAFYNDTFHNLRKVGDTPIVLHDGFWKPSWLNGFLTPSENAYNVIMDHHEYQIFDPNGNSLSVKDHLGRVCASQEFYSNVDKWTIVAEWSGALTDCAPHLNGFKQGNRYEGSWWGSWYMGSCKGKSGNVSSWSEEWKNATRMYIEAQLDAFEARTNGWAFWNFKTENNGAGEWDLFQLLDNGVFPQPIWERKFPRACEW